MSGSADLRIAIVGCGPKGLFALERLVALAGASGGTRRLSVDVYEPHPVPGAGPVYDPAQPGYLRMNFAAGMVDMWPAGSGLGPSFSEWRSGRPGMSGEAYPPRADVGRYLAAGFERVVSSAGEHLAIRVIQASVDRVEAAGESWSLTAGDEDAAYDEVLLATGHAGSWAGALAAAPPPTATLVGAVFPVEKRLAADEVPPGSRVAIRGFALTMIDAALALTEGRGGRFAEGREPHLLRYEPGESEVALILPFSRTGRPMLAKPDPALAPSSPELDAIGLEGRKALIALPEDAPLAASTAIVRDVAAASLDSAGGSGAPEIVEMLGEPRRGRFGADPAEEIERSIAVGVGRGRPGAAWALGHAWRAVYPALVERLGANGLDESEWPAFRRLASEMERIAFGPPPVNAAKLLALIEHGKVDLARAAGPAPGADVVVDAVLPPPGLRDVAQPPFDSLLRAGHVRIPAGRRGLELTADVTCVGVDGAPRPGLGAIGRPTEDWVIGNDTLNRELHPQAEAWARRVVGRASG